MDYKELILTKLINSYEKSASNMEGNYKRKTYFNFRRSFVEYVIDDFDIKSAIHYAVYELKNENIVDIIWAKYQEGNIIEKVVLNNNNLEKAYQMLGRIPKNQMLFDIQNMLTDCLSKINSSDWIKSFINDCKKEIECRYEISQNLPKEKEQILLVLKALEGIDHKGENEYLERVFSKKYLGNSKIFGKIKGTIKNIIENYYLKYNLDNEKDILESIGIIETYDDTMFFGNIKIKLDNKIIDYSYLHYGTSINVDTIREMQISELHAKKIITIENKAAYLEYIKKADTNEFVIYLAGYYSKSKRLFLKKIYEHLYSCDVEYFHWGDIDYGGISIFILLRDIIPEIRPVNMCIATLKAYIRDTEPLTLNDVKNISRLIDNDKSNEFINVMEYMLKQNIKLEQEALL